MPSGLRVARKRSAKLEIFQLRSKVRSFFIGHHPFLVLSEHFLLMLNEKAARSR